MPRYYFDTIDGDLSVRDAEGVVIDDPEEVRRRAVSALPELARDDLPDGADDHVFIVRVRDEDGRHVFHATLSLVTDWMD